MYLGKPNTQLKLEYPEISIPNMELMLIYQNELMLIYRFQICRICVGYKMRCPCSKDMKKKEIHSLPTQA